MSVKANPLQDIKCAVETPLYQFASQLADITEEECRSNKINDSILDPMLGCLKGHRNFIVGGITGIYDFFKIVLYHTPKWAIQHNLGYYQAALAGDLSPSEMASRIADHGAKRNKEMWETAKSYWEGFKQYAVDLKNGLIEHSKGFFCKPVKEQTQIICRAVDEVFLAAIGAGIAINSTRGAATVARSTNNFLKALKEAEATKNLSLAESLDIAASAVRGVGTTVAQVPQRVLLHSRNGTLREVTLPSGTNVLKYERKVVGADGKIHVEDREVPVDSKTRAIDANGEVGKIIIADIVDQSKGKGSMLLIDVNDLGLVNHFDGGLLTGDKYLSEVGRSIRETLRSDDVFFKFGGDELVVVLPESNPAVVQQISQRISDAVYSNPEIKKIFEGGFANTIRSHSDLRRAFKYNDLPDSFRLSLTESERRLAQLDFTRFKDQQLKKYETVFAKRTSEGSVAIGATIIRSDDSAHTAFMRANELSNRAKVEYKSTLNQDITKYGTDGNIETATTPLTPSRAGPAVVVDPLN